MDRRKMMEVAALFASSQMANALKIKARMEGMADMPGSPFALLNTTITVYDVNEVPDIRSEDILKCYKAAKAAEAERIIDKTIQAKRRKLAQHLRKQAFG